MNKTRFVLTFDVFVVQGKRRPPFHWHLKKKKHRKNGKGILSTNDILNLVWRLSKSTLTFHTEFAAYRIV